MQSPPGRNIELKTDPLNIQEKIPFNFEAERLGEEGRF